MKKCIPYVISAIILTLSFSDTGFAAEVTGPSSSREPYVSPSASNVHTYSIISVGDAVMDTGYRMVGIPDGLGAIDHDDLTFSVFMHHELRDDVGIARAHGGRGALISQWRITKPGHPDGNFKVISGNDAIATLNLWDPATSSYYATADEAINRLCSADLAESSAFYYALKHGDFKRGTRERIFLGGEENDAFSGGNYGRALATIVTGPNKGQSYELPLLGNMAFENIVASPYMQKKTVVALLDDSASQTTDTLGEVYFYIGEKENCGLEIDQAGLTNGSLYGLKIFDLPVEDAAHGLGAGAGSKANFKLVNLGDFSDDDGTLLFAKTVAYNPYGVTKFLRPEDGHWDPTQPDVFYFITTGASYDSDGDGTRETSGPGRIWKLTFYNIKSPVAGGVIELVLDGTEGITSPDNLTVDNKGHLYIQEDPGSSAGLAKIWRYQPAVGNLEEVAAHNAKFFDSGSPNFITTNEESSGIIDMSAILGEGWFLFDSQSHISVDGPGEDANRAMFGFTLDEGIEFVEDGQLLAAFIPQKLVVP
jgi:hypothetical protein